MVYRHREPAPWVGRGHTPMDQTTPIRRPRLESTPAARVSAACYSGRLMKHDKIVFFCRPDELGVLAHFWEGDTGLLCRHPSMKSPVEAVRCPRHRMAAEEQAAKKRGR
jgi:hypothetical protein